jgi:hypothetical protein
MGLQTHISRRGAVYYFRLRVPADLVAVIGRKELRRTLAASRPEEARPRGARLLAAARRLFTALRSGPMRPRHEIEEIVRSFYQTKLDEEFCTWLGQPATWEELTGRLDPADRPKGRREQLGHHVAIRDPALAAHDALKDIAKRLAYSPEPGSDEENLVLALLMRALIELTHAQEARLAGKPYHVARDPLFAAAVPNGVPAPPPSPDPFAGLAAGAKLPVAAHVDDFLKVKGRSIKNTKTLGDYKRSLASLAAVLGDRPIGAVSELDILGYKKAMLEAPAHFETRFKTADPREAAALNKRRKEPFERFSDTTLDDKYFTNVRTFFEWAKDDKLVAANPAKALRVPRSPKGKGRNPSRDRHPFTPDELKRIFGSRLFGPEGPRDHNFWAPLLTLFSGIRPNEIGLLELPDLVMKWGWPHLNVTDLGGTSLEGEADEDGYDPRADNEKSLKTPAAKRLVPLHPELERIGFLEYVEDARRIKAGNRLFPEMAPDRHGYHSAALRWFNRTFLPGLKVKRRKNSFYSFRHNAEDAFDASGISEKTRDRIMGHKRADMPSRYGAGELLAEQSLEYRSKFRYEDLDLSHIRYRPDPGRAPA